MIVPTGQDTDLGSVPFATTTMFLNCTELSETDVVSLGCGIVIVLEFIAVTCPCAFVVTCGTVNVPPNAGDVFALGPIVSAVL